MSRRLARSLPVLLLLAFFGQGMLHARRASITFDEGPHLAVGYTALRTGDFRLQPVHIHPPLANVLAAAPLLLQDDLPEPRTIDGWEIASLSAVTDAVIWQYPHPARIALAGRLPILLLAVLTGALICRWARDLAGRSAGLLALTLFAFDPNLIAHGSLITTDMAAVFFIVATLYAVFRLQLSVASFQPSAAKLLTIGCLLGLAQLAKVSALLLVPVVGLMLLIDAYLRYRNESRIVNQESGTANTELRVANYELRSTQPAARKTSHASRFTFYVLRSSALVFGIAALVLWAGYGFEIVSVPGFPFPVPAGTHLRIFQSLREHYDLGHPTFLMGRISSHGWWWYFPVAFILKTPLPTLVLSCGAVLCAFCDISKIENRKSKILSLALWLFPALYAISSLFSSVNIGYRHLLPVLPFLCIGMGVGVKKLEIRNRQLKDKLRFTLYVLLVWFIAGTLRIAPDYLTFFNALAGGSGNGYRYLVDSNLDWGQNLWDLCRWMIENGEGRVAYAHYSPARPATYGIDADFLPPDPRAVDFAPWNPAAGLYAIGATVLQGPYAPDINTYAWFRARKPDAVLGNALFVYRVAPQPSPEWAVLCTDAGVSEETLKRNLDVAQIRVLWIDCAQTQVYPAGGARGLYLIGEPSLFAESQRIPLRSPDGTYTLAINDTITTPPAPLSPIADPGFDGPLTLLGSTQRDLAQLWTYWRVDTIPDRPLSLMAHLIGPDGTATAVGDGLGFPLEQWQPGDVIVQRHNLSVPPDAPAGTYTIVTGAYWLDTMERWPTREGTTEIVLMEVRVP